MNRQPKTIRQLDRQLKHAYIDTFPYGKHKNKLVADVVKEDPNYIVWWDEAVEQFPLDPKIVATGEKNYRHLQPSGHWKKSVGHWDHWGDSCDGDFDLEDWADMAEAIDGNPWGFGK